MAHSSVFEAMAASPASFNLIDPLYHRALVFLSPSWRVRQHAHVYFRGPSVVLLEDANCLAPVPEAHGKFWLDALELNG